MTKTLLDSPTLSPEKESKLQAQSLLSEGKTKQEAYTLLREQFPRRPTAEALAKTLQAIPTEKKKAQYRILVWVLCGLLAFGALTKVLTILPLVSETSIAWIFVFLAPLVNIVCVWGYLNYRMDFFKFVPLLVVLSTVRSSLNEVVVGGGDTSNYLDLGFSVLIVILSLICYFALFPAYKIEEETYQTEKGQSKKRKIYKFSD